MTVTKSNDSREGNGSQQRETTVERKDIVRAMTMRKMILSSLVVLPLLLSFSHATQNWSVDPALPLAGIPSEDSTTGSFLGVNIDDVTTDRLGALKLKEEKGVEVTTVDEDAPAGKAGIKEHDVILNMNGTPIESKVQLQRMIHETPPGRVVTFSISRDGQPLTIKVQLGDRRKQYAWGPKMKDFHVEIPPIPDLNIEVPQINVMVVRSSARSGLMVENITPQLGEFFGVKNGNGVLVRSVEKGSRGDKAGFHAGDVIVKINDQPVHDTSDFTEVMHSRESGAVSVGVIREKKEQKLNLELPPHKESGYMIDEESMDEPLFDADDEMEMAEDEVADLQPEMELVSEQSERAAEAEDAARQAVCEAEQLAQEQKGVREEVQQQQMERLKELQDQLKEQSDALKSQLEQKLQQQDVLSQKHQTMTREQRRMQQEQEKMMKDIERLRQQMPKGGFDL
jgi:serine protease Do